MKKNNKTKRLTLGEIEAIPIEERTQEEWELLEQYFFETATPQERERAEKISKSFCETIDYYFKDFNKASTDSKHISREEFSTYWFKKVREREQALKEKEAELKKRETKLETEKKRLKEAQTGSYRKPKHLVNAMTQLRPLTNKGASLFNGLDETVAPKFKTPLMIGLELSRGERKLVNCFSLMLHQRSQTIDASKDNYFSGDTNNPTFERYSSDDIIAPKPELRFTLYELSKVYTRKANPSGRDIKIVRELLESLLHKTYYVELEKIEYKDKNGDAKRVSWRGKIALFMLGKVDNGEVLIQLNSLFALQIRDYYVNYPINFDELLENSYLELYNSGRVSTGVYVFIDYLASIRGAKNIYKHEIYKSNLYEKINYKWLRESRKAKLEETINRGIEVAQRIGLLEKYEEVAGATGEIKYIFYTRKDWIKK